MNMPHLKRCLLAMGYMALAILIWSPSNTTIAEPIAQKTSFGMNSAQANNVTKFTKYTDKLANPIKKSAHKEKIVDRRLLGLAFFLLNQANINNRR